MERVSLSHPVYKHQRRARIGFKTCVSADVIADFVQNARACGYRASATLRNKMGEVRQRHVDTEVRGK